MPRTEPGTHNNTIIRSDVRANGFMVYDGAEGLSFAGNLYVNPNQVTGHYQSFFMYMADDDLKGAYWKNEPYEPVYGALSSTSIADNLWPMAAGQEWCENGVHYLLSHWSSKEGCQSESDWEAHPQVAGDEYWNVVLDDDFRPMTEHADIVRRLPGVITDFYGNPRPDAEPWTAGAVQR